MRKYAISIAAGCAFAGALALTPASAAPLGSQDMRKAIGEAGMVEQVHCRPGRWHHRNGPPDGCYRESRSYYYYDRPYYRDRYYYRSGPGVGLYGPGGGLYFGF